MTSHLRGLFAVLSVAAIVSCSPPQPQPQEPETTSRWAELCGDVTCGAGRCVVDREAPVCICDAGFAAQGLTCVAVAPDDPCAPNPCSEFGRTRCEAEGTVARCLCDEGRVEVGGTCVPKTPCTPNPCTLPFQSVCLVDGANATCVCDPGHAPAEVGCDPNPVFDCGVVHTTGEPDGFEPDECPSLSSELIPGLGAAQHSINPAGDVDYFAIHAESGHVYEVTATGASTLSLYADAYAADGVTPIGADHAGATTIALRFKAQATGPVYVRMRALRGNDIGPYAIAAKDLGFDDFPDTTATALSVTGNSSFGGALQFGGDVDVFRIPVQASVAYGVHVDAATATPLRVELLGSDGATVKQHRVGDDLKFITRSGTSGFLFVRISGFDPQLLSGYTVTTTILGPDDHADVPEEATPITAGGAGVAVTLERPDDVDLLSFNAVASRIYTVTCTAVGSYANADIALLDEDGNVLDTDSSGYTLANETVVPGKRFIRVDLWYPSQTASKFTCKLQDLGTDDHGDDPATASPVTAGAAPLAAKLETTVDKDVFSFNAQANRIYRFTCTVGQGGSCALKLLSSSGVQIASGSSVLAYELASSGTYFFEVSYYSSFSAGGSYTYALEDLGTDDHGDTVGTATAAPALGQSTPGVFETTQDKDLFSFTATASHIYRVTCTAQVQTSCIIRFLTAAGLQVATSSSSSSSVTVLAAELPTSGTYYVELSTSSYSGSGGAYTWVLDDVGVDDHGDDVNSATVITAGDSGSATLEFAGDVDAFKVTPVAGRVYRFTCGKGSVPTCDLRVKDSAGALLASTSSSSSTSISWEASSTSPIVFTVGEGSYQKPQGTFSWSLTDIGTDDHGDSLATATAVTLPMNVTAAQLEGFGDLDVFSVAATAGRVYRFTCTKGTAPNCGVRAKDAAGATLSTTQGSSSSAAVLSLAAPATGPLYFEVYDGGYSGPVGAGTYSWMLEDLGPDDHGNGPSTATPITVGPTGLGGNIQFPGDKDVFSFTPTIGHIYKATCPGAPASLGSNCALVFQTSSGAILASGSGPVAWKATQAATVYVEVRSYWSSGTGGYTLVVEDLGTDDHGDTYQSATALTLGVASSGTLETSGDVDYFSISLAASTSYTLTVTNGTYIDTIIYSSNGTSMIATGSPGATFTTGAAGTYYVRVYHWTSSASTTAYTIKVQ